MSEEIYQFEKKLEETSNYIKSLREAGPMADEILIKTYHSLNELINRSLSLEDFLYINISNKFDLWKDTSMKKISYYNEIFSKEQMIFFVYFIIDERPFYLIVNKEAHTQFDEMYPCIKIYPKQDYCVIHLEGLKNIIQCASLSRQNLELLFKHKFEILFVNKNFENEKNLFSNLFQT